jgi:hypothetical protein
MVLALGAAIASNAQTYYSITSGGGQNQIGDGLPVPIQQNRTPMGGPIGTKTMFPPLLIPVNPDPAKALVKQTGLAPAQLKLAPGALRRVPTTPNLIALANNNPKVFQIRTKISFSEPGSQAGTKTFKKDGWRTKAVSFAGAPGNAAAFYSGSTNRFGSPAQTRVAALSKVGVWVNAGAMLPCKHPLFGGANASCVAPKVRAVPVAAAGGAMTMGGKVTAGTTLTTPGTPTTPGLVAVSIPNTKGLIAKSATLVKTGTLTNMATSVGFPWTTGKIVLSQPSAFAAFEKFTITGKDSRTAMGVGTLSLVSGALSDRTVSGPNSNKSWMRVTLPEPGAVLGAVAALASLGICHEVMRRRERA